MAIGRGAGRPLDAATNAYFGKRFGRSFDDVRVKTDDASARSAGALAYTVGRQIVFREHAYAPGTLDGRRLLAHELAHVVQQQGSGPPLSTTSEAEGLEGEAERAAAPSPGKTSAP